MQAEATLTTRGGNVLHAVDTYTKQTDRQPQYPMHPSTTQLAAAPDSDIVVSRTVTLTTPVSDINATEVGFSTRYTLTTHSPGQANPFRSLQFFIPGIWYLNSQAVSPPGALAGASVMQGLLQQTKKDCFNKITPPRRAHARAHARALSLSLSLSLTHFLLLVFIRPSCTGNLDASHVLVREDRLPIPLAMVRMLPASAVNNTLTMAHVHPDGSRCAHPWHMSV